MKDSVEVNNPVMSGQTIVFRPGRPEDLAAFIQSFQDSELGRHYFSSEEFIRETFAEFLEKKTILTAV
ncbi:MAG: hypothetical protein JW874_03125 [Spirochaetales bacterium]|nr:hypothetical protein [Spirochaetales bacterium]